MDAERTYSCSRCGWTFPPAGDEARARKIVLMCAHTYPEYAKRRSGACAECIAAALQGARREVGEPVKRAVEQIEELLDSSWRTDMKDGASVCDQCDAEWSNHVDGCAVGEALANLRVLTALAHPSGAPGDR